MNVLVLEYETGMIQEIKDLLYAIDDSINVIGVTGSMFDAAEWVMQNSIPDLILANETLIEREPFHQQRLIRAKVTISTTSGHYNLAAFRYKNIRQLLHPSSPKEINASRNTLPGKFKERFLVKQGQRLVSVAVDQIAYFFSQERFIFFKTFDNQKFLLEYRIEELEQLLSPASFYRVNRSFIVSLPTVREIHSYFGNRLKLYLTPPADKEVIVSRKRVNDFKKWLDK
jgi:two-component system, LytTR family, response regulator LytT